MISSFIVSQVPMPLSEMCAKVINVINALSLVAGIITGGIGGSMIPQTVYNNGNIYVGTGEQYQADLRAAQLSSYGFKVTIAGVSMVLYSLVGFACMHYHNNIDFRRNAVDVFPEQVQPPKPIKSILKDTSDSELKRNIKKWIGDVKREDIV